MYIIENISWEGEWYLFIYSTSKCTHVVYWCDLPVIVIGCTVGWADCAAGICITCPPASWLASIFVTLMSPSTVSGGLVKVDNVCTSIFWPSFVVITLVFPVILLPNALMPSTYKKKTMCYIISIMYICMCMCVSACDARNTHIVFHNTQFIKSILPERC